MKKALYFAAILILAAVPSVFAVESEAINAQCTYVTSDVACEDTWTATCNITDTVSGSSGIDEVRIYLHPDSGTGVLMERPTDTLNGTWTFNISGYNTYDEVRINRIVIENSVGTVCDATNNQQSEFCFIQLASRDYANMTCALSCEYDYEYEFFENNTIRTTVLPSADCNEESYSFTTVRDFCQPNWVPNYACEPANEGRHNEFPQVYASYEEDYEYYYETRYSYPLTGFANKTYIDLNYESCCQETGLASDCEPPLEQSGAVACLLDFWNAEGKSSSMDRYNTKGGPVDTSLREFSSNTSSFLSPVVFDMTEDRFNNIIFFSDGGYIDMYDSSMNLVDTQAFRANVSNGTVIESSQTNSWDLNDRDFGDATGNEDLRLIMDDPTYLGEYVFGDPKTPEEITNMSYNSYQGYSNAPLMEFGDNGNKVFVSTQSSVYNLRGIFEYNLQDPYNLSSMDQNLTSGSSTFHSINDGYSAPVTYPFPFTFNDAGSKLYIYYYTDNVVVEYDLSQNWEINTRNSPGNVVLNLTNDNFEWVQDIDLIDGESKFFLANENISTSVGPYYGIARYDLTTPGDMGTATFGSNMKIPRFECSTTATEYALSGNDFSTLTTVADGREPYFTVPISFAFDSSGSKLYVIDSDVGTQRGNGIVQYDLGISWDVSTATMNSYDDAFIGYPHDACTGVYGNEYNGGTDACDSVARNFTCSQNVETTICSSGDPEQYLQGYDHSGLEVAPDGNSFYALVSEYPAECGSNMPQHKDWRRVFYRFDVAQTSTSEQVAAPLVQPVMTGVNEYLGDQSINTCVGTPQSCDTYEDRDSCGNSSGCYWMGTYCEGNANSCEVYRTSATCGEANGCSWDTPDPSVYAWGGSEFAPTICVDTATTNQFQDACVGTPNQCNMYDDQSSCTNVGCAWDSLWGCYDEPTGCGAFGTENSCTDSGCFWGREYYEKGESCSTCNSITDEDERTECCQTQGKNWIDPPFCAGISDTCSIDNLPTAQACLDQGCTPGYSSGNTYASCTGSPKSCYDDSLYGDIDACLDVEGCQWKSNICESDHAIVVVGGERDFVFVGQETNFDGLIIEGVGTTTGPTTIELKFERSVTDTYNIGEEKTVTSSVNGQDYEVAVVGIHGPNVDLSCVFSSCSMQPSLETSPRENAMGFASIVEGENALQFTAQSYLPFYGFSSEKTVVDIEMSGARHGLATDLTCLEGTCYFVSLTSTQVPEFHLWEVKKTSDGLLSPEYRTKQITNLPANPVDINISNIGDMALVQTKFSKPEAVTFTINYEDGIELVACPTDWSACDTISVDFEKDTVNSSIIYEGLGTGDYRASREGAYVYVTGKDVEYVGASGWVDGNYTITGQICEDTDCRPRYEYTPGYWDNPSGVKAYGSEMFFALLKNNNGSGVRWDTSSAVVFEPAINNSQQGVAGTDIFITEPAVGPCYSANSEGVAVGVFYSNMTSNTAFGELQCYFATGDARNYTMLYSIPIPEFNHSGQVPENQLHLADIDEDNVAEIISSEGGFDQDGSKIVDFTQYGMFYNNTNYVIPIDVTSEKYMDFIASGTYGTKTLLSVPAEIVQTAAPGEGTSFEGCIARFNSDTYRINTVPSSVVIAENRQNLEYTTALYLTNGSSNAAVNQTSNEQSMSVKPPELFGDATYHVYYVVYDPDAIGEGFATRYCGEVEVPAQFEETTCSIGDDGEFNFNSFTNTDWIAEQEYFPELSQGYARLIGGDDLRYNLKCGNERVWLSSKISTQNAGSGTVYLSALNRYGENVTIGGVYYEGREVFLLDDAGYTPVYALGDSQEWVEFSLEFEMVENRYTMYVDGFSVGQAEFVERADGDVEGIHVGRDAGELRVDYVRLEGEGSQRADSSGNIFNPYRVQPLANCYNGTRDFEAQSVGEIGTFDAINEYCNRVNNDAGYCNIDDLKRAIQFNQFCYYEANNYCQAWTYPLSNGFEDFSEFDGPVLNRSTVEGTAACTTALTAGATMTNVLEPAINGIWILFQENLFATMLLLGFILLVIAGLVLYGGKK